jgi:hypothetical protein
MVIPGVSIGFVLLAWDAVVIPTIISVSARIADRPVVKGISSILPSAYKLIIPERILEKDRKVDVKKENTDVHVDERERRDDRLFVALLVEKLLKPLERAKYAGHEHYRRLQIE